MRDIKLKDRIDSEFCGSELKPYLAKGNFRVLTA